MMRMLCAAALLGAALAVPVAATAAGPDQPASVNWSFNGLFGTLDQASARRGFEVFNAACANCHSLKQAYYRNLTGIGLTEEQVKEIAASKMVAILKPDGTPGERPALPSDHIRSPFPNELAARNANNGNLPPDLSVITKAREGGPDYIYSVLTGYSEPPAGFELMEGMSYNRAFPGHQIAMFQPVSDGDIEYTDGTKSTLDQEAKDVVTFLAYIASPEMDERKRLGGRAFLFVLLLTGLTYLVKRKVWAGVH